jgi:hypothetical protein
MQYYSYNTKVEEFIKINFLRLFFFLSLKRIILYVFFSIWERCLTLTTTIRKESFLCITKTLQILGKNNWEYFRPQLI